MTTWNFEETRKHLMRIHGAKDRNRVSQYLRSIADRKAYARYHFREFERLLNAYLESKGEEEPESLFRWLSVEGGEDEFNEFILYVAAHIVACLQSLHSLQDILAHVIYHSLDLAEPKPLAEHRIDFGSVMERLQTRSEYPTLLTMMSEMQGEICTLSALVNHMKHRSLVFPSLSEDWTGLQAERHTIMIPEFTYKKDVYPAVVARAFLIAEHDRISKQVVDIGIELNRILEAAPAKLQSN